MQNRPGQTSLQKIYQALIAATPWVLFAGMLQFSFQKFLPGQRFFKGEYGFDYFTIIDFFVVAVVVIFAIGFARKQIKFEPRKLPIELMLAIGLLLVAGVLEVFFQHPYGPILNSPFFYFRSFFIFPIVWLLLVYKTADHNTLEKLVKNYLLMVLFFCVFALVQYLFGVFPGEQKDFTGRLVWPFIDFLTLKSSSANWVAFFVTPAVIMGFIKIFTGTKNLINYPFQVTNHELEKFGTKEIALEIKMKNYKLKVIDLALYNCVFLLGAIVLYLTQSYGAYTAVFAAIGLYLFRSMKFKKFLAVAIAMLLLAGGVYLVQKNSYKYKIMTGQTAYRYDNSVASRGDILKMNWAMIKQNPLLGVGLNAYQSYFTINQKNVLGHQYKESMIPPHAHNFFLSFYTNLGLFGFLAMLILVIGIFWRYKLDPHNPLLFVLVAIMIHGLIDSYYWKQEIAYLFWMVVLLAYLYREKAISNQHDS